MSKYLSNIVGAHGDPHKNNLLPETGHCDYA